MKTWALFLLLLPIVNAAPLSHGKPLFNLKIYANGRHARLVQNRPDTPDPQSNNIVTNAPVTEEPEIASPDTASEPSETGGENTGEVRANEGRPLPPPPKVNVVSTNYFHHPVGAIQSVPTANIGGNIVMNRFSPSVDYEEKEVLKEDYDYYDYLNLRNPAQVPKESTLVTNIRDDTEADAENPAEEEQEQEQQQNEEDAQGEESEGEAIRADESEDQQEGDTIATDAGNEDGAPEEGGQDNESETRITEVNADAAGEGEQENEANATGTPTELEQEQGQNQEQEQEEEQGQNQEQEQEQEQEGEQLESEVATFGLQTV